MSTFDPTKPALLHDQLNDDTFAWTGEMKEHWLEHAAPAGAGIIG